MSNIKFGLKKIGSTGRSSKILILPSVWCQSLNVATGDSASVEMRPSGELVIKLIRKNSTKSTIGEQNNG